MKGNEIERNLKSDLVEEMARAYVEQCGIDYVIRELRRREVITEREEEELKEIKKLESTTVELLLTALLLGYVLNNKEVYLYDSLEYNNWYYYPFKLKFINKKYYNGGEYSGTSIEKMDLKEWVELRGHFLTEIRL